VRGGGEEEELVAGEGAEGACELGVGNARVAGEVVEGEAGLRVEEAEDAGLADADEQRVVLVRLQLHAPALPHPLQLPPRCFPSYAS